MLKKYASITLLVSLIAVGSSGLLMMFSHDLAYKLQMHPVHEVFGIIMCVSGVFHVYFNFRPIVNYLGKRSIRMAGIWLTVLLIFLYALGLTVHHEPTEEIEGATFHAGHR